MDPLNVGVPLAGNRTTVDPRSLTTHVFHLAGGDTLADVRWTTTDADGKNRATGTLALPLNQAVQLARSRAIAGARAPNALAHNANQSYAMAVRIVQSAGRRAQRGAPGAAVEEGEIRVADLVRLVMLGLTGSNPAGTDEASNYLPWDAPLGEAGVADHYRSAAWAASAVAWLWNVASSFPTAIQIGAYLDGLRSEAASLPPNQDRDAHIEMVQLSHTAALALATIPNAPVFAGGAAAGAGAPQGFVRKSMSSLGDQGKPGKQSKGESMTGISSRFSQKDQAGNAVQALNSRGPGAAAASAGFAALRSAVDAREDAAMFTDPSVPGPSSHSSRAFPSHLPNPSASSGGPSSSFQAKFGVDNEIGGWAKEADGVGFTGGDPAAYAAAQEAQGVEQIRLKASDTLERFCKRGWGALEHRASTYLASDHFGKFLAADLIHVQGLGYGGVVVLYTQFLVPLHLEDRGWLPQHHASRGCSGVGVGALLDIITAEVYEVDRPFNVIDDPFTSALRGGVQDRTYQGLLGPRLNFRKGTDKLELTDVIDTSATREDDKTSKRARLAALKRLQGLLEAHPYTRKLRLDAGDERDAEVIEALTAVNLRDVAKYLARFAPENAQGKRVLDGNMATLRTTLLNVRDALAVVLGVLDYSPTWGIDALVRYFEDKAQGRRGQPPIPVPRIIHALGAIFNAAHLLVLDLVRRRASGREAGTILPSFHPMGVLVQQCDTASVAWQPNYTPPVDQLGGKVASQVGGSTSKFGLSVLPTTAETKAAAKALKAQQSERRHDQMLSATKLGASRAGGKQGQGGGAAKGGAGGAGGRGNISAAAAAAVPAPVPGGGKGGKGTRRVRNVLDIFPSSCMEHGECGFCRQPGHKADQCDLLAKSDAILSAPGLSPNACMRHIISMATTGAFTPPCSFADCKYAHDQPWTQQQAIDYCDIQAQRVGGKRKGRAGKGPLDDGGARAAAKWKC